MIRIFGMCLIFFSSFFLYIYFYPIPNPKQNYYLLLRFCAPKKIPPSLYPLLYIRKILMMYIYWIVSHVWVRAFSSSSSRCACMSVYAYVCDDDDIVKRFSEKKLPAPFASMPCSLNRRLSTDVSVWRHRKPLIILW